MMSILREKQFPRAQNIPDPPAPPPPRPPSPEVVAFFQGRVDDQAEIARLRQESDHWRSRAVTAEEQIKQLEKNLDRQEHDNDHKVATIMEHHDREYAKLSSQHQADVERLTEERDRYKLGYARTRERLHVAGKVILDTLEADRNIDIEAQALKAVESEIAKLAPPVPNPGPDGPDRTNGK